MVTKVSLFISTTETEQKTSEQKHSRYCVAATSQPCNNRIRNRTYTLLRVPACHTDIALLFVW